MNELTAVCVEHFDPVVVPKQNEGEGLSAKARDFKHFEVKRVGTTSLIVPSDLVRYRLLSSINHVKILVVIHTDQQLVSGEFDCPGHVAVLEVNLSQNHLQFEHMLDQVSLHLSKEQSVVATQREFMLATYFEHFKNSVYFQRLLGENLLEVIYSEHINVSEVLAKQQEFFFLPIRQGVVFISHYVIYPLLQLLVLLTFKSVEVKDEKMAFVATHIHQISVNQTAEHSMTTCLFHSLSLKRLRINNVQLVALASRKD